VPIPNHAPTASRLTGWPRRAALIPAGRSANRRRIADDVSDR